jgi:hypothetical protein
MRLFQLVKVTKEKLSVNIILIVKSCFPTTTGTKHCHQLLLSLLHCAQDFNQEFGNAVIKRVIGYKTEESKPRSEHDES